MIFVYFEKVNIKSSDAIYRAAQYIAFCLLPSDKILTIDTEEQTLTFTYKSGMKFRDVEGQDLLIFKPNHNGNMQIIISAYPFMILQKIGMSDTL